MMTALKPCQATSGIRLLAALVAEGHGFQRLSFANRAVTVVLKAMRLHGMDADVCAPGLHVIGWACRSFMELSIAMRKNGFMDIVKENKVHWR